MAKDAPDAYVVNMSKKKRKGKIFIDFFRNDYSSTAIVPFSLRARPGAAIAWPVSWTDLKKIQSADSFQITGITDADFKKAQKNSADFWQVSQPLRLE